MSLRPDDTRTLEAFNPALEALSYMQMPEEGSAGFRIMAALLGCDESDDEGQVYQALIDELTGPSVLTVRQDVSDAEVGKVNQALQEALQEGIMAAREFDRRTRGMRIMTAEDLGRRSR